MNVTLGVTLFIIAVGLYGIWVTRKDPNASKEQETVDPQQFVTKAELEEIIKAQQLATKADLQEFATMPVPKP